MELSSAVTVKAKAVPAVADEGALTAKWVAVARLKVAVTDCAAFIVTEHAPVPLQAPLQPANTDPAAAVAVSETTVPLA